MVKYLREMAIKWKSKGVLKRILHFATRAICYRLQKEDGKVKCNEFENILIKIPHKFMLQMNLELQLFWIDDAA